MLQARRRIRHDPQANRRQAEQVWKSHENRKIWQYANVAMLMKFPNPPPAGVFRPSANPDKSVKKRKGFTRRNDISLNWVAATFPELEQWRALGAEYLKGREAGLAHALAGVNALIDFLSALNLPTDQAPSCFIGLSFQTSTKACGAQTARTGRYLSATQHITSLSGF